MDVEVSVSELVEEDEVVVLVKVSLEVVVVVVEVLEIEWVLEVDDRVVVGSLTDDEVVELEVTEYKN